MNTNQTLQSQQQNRIDLGLDIIPVNNTTTPTLNNKEIKNIINSNNILNLKVDAMSEAVNIIKDTTNEINIDVKDARGELKEGFRQVKGAINGIKDSGGITKEKCFKPKNLYDIWECIVLFILFLLQILFVIFQFYWYFMKTSVISLDRGTSAIPIPYIGPMFRFFCVGYLILFYLNNTLLILTLISHNQVDFHNLINVTIGLSYDVLKPYVLLLFNTDNALLTDIKRMIPDNISNDTILVKDYIIDSSKSAFGSTVGAIGSNVAEQVTNVGSNIVESAANVGSNFVESATNVGIDLVEKTSSVFNLKIFGGSSMKSRKSSKKYNNSFNKSYKKSSRNSMKSKRNSMKSSKSSKKYNNSFNKSSKKSSRNSMKSNRSRSVTLKKNNKVSKSINDINYFIKQSGSIMLYLTYLMEGLITLNNNNNNLNNYNDENCVDLFMLLNKKINTPYGNKILLIH